MNENESLRIRQKTLEDEIRYLRDYAKKIITSPNGKDRSKSLRGDKRES